MGTPDNFEFIDPLPDPNRGRPLLPTPAPTTGYIVDQLDGDGWLVHNPHTVSAYAVIRGRNAHAVAARITEILNRGSLQ